ncbi:MAG: hypothetical protein WKF70_02870, partial [Chitinophagaceae bacterium]
MKMIISGAPISSLYLVIVSSLLFSCVASRGFRGDTALARDKDKKAFVQTTDGTVSEANETVLRTPFFKKSFIELDKSVRIPTKDVIAYQNGQAYFRRVAGQFAPRIKKGLINMYRTSETYQDYSPGTSRAGSGWSTRTRIVYHLQKGDNAAVEKFSPSVTKTYVQDYAPAKDFIDVYDATQKKVKTWSWINTGAVVGSFFMMAQGSKGSTLTPVGAAGLGLFVGGLVNGVVNKVRKGRNFANLELAIDAYNGQQL